MNLLGRVLIITLVSCVVYAGFIQFAPAPEVRRYQSQWDDNRAGAQSYIYGKHRDVVIVGSSLSRRLPEYGLGSCVQNLSFAGGASATGIAIVLKAEGLPKQLLIEINHLERMLDTAFIDEVFSPLAGLKIFRVENKPINYLISRFSSLFVGARREHERKMTQIPTQAEYQIAKRIQQRELEATPDQFKISQAILLLKANVELLEKKGVRVTFLEMPIDDDLTNLRYPTEIRRALQNEFGTSREILSIRPPVPGSLRARISPISTDGIHLSYPAAFDLATTLSEKYGCPVLRTSASFESIGHPLV